MSGESIDFIFSEEGVLGGLKNYRKRQGQIDMAQAVQKALTQSQYLVAEAGTGTGKTFAYLVPVLMSGGRAIVATYSLTLQDQLFSKDTTKLAELLRHPCSVVKIKGVSNYVCLERLDKLVKNSWHKINTQARKKAKNEEDKKLGHQIDMFAEADEDSNAESQIKLNQPLLAEYVQNEIALQPKDLEKIEAYIKCLEAGEDDDMASLMYNLDGKDMKDLGEISSLRRYLKHKNVLQSVSDTICRHAVIRINYEKCLGAKDCPFTKYCPYQKVKDKAKKAKLVILNHSMFCRLSDATRTAELKQQDRDLAENEKDSTESPKGIFTDFDLCIIDEAHHFPQVVKDTFSRMLSTESFARVAAQIDNLLPKLIGIYGEDRTLCDMMEEIMNCSYAFQNKIEAFVGALKRVIPPENPERYQRFLGGGKGADTTMSQNNEQLMDGNLVYGLGSEAYNVASGFHEQFVKFMGLFNRYGTFANQELEALWQAYQTNNDNDDANDFDDAKKTSLLSEKFYRSSLINSALKALKSEQKDIRQAQDKQVDKGFYISEARSLRSELEYLRDTMIEIGQFIEEYFVELLFGRPFDNTQNYRSASWRENNNRVNFELQICPYSAGAEFRKRILDIGSFANTGFVFTSATIGTGVANTSSFNRSNFGANASSSEDKDTSREQLATFTHELLLPPEKTNTLLAESPFAYDTHGLLYVPEIFGKFDDPKGMNSLVLVEGIAPVLRKVSGGILVLCTAMRSVKYLYDAFKKDPTLRKRTILRQEEGSNRMELVNKFRDNGRAILIGTKSFWEGVDIQGSALSAVVIDKLPFPAPGVSLRAEREYAQNVLHQLPFIAVDLPRAIIDLKQGVGRLIRCESDRGVVIICDPRLLNAKKKSYRTQIMSALPKFAYTENEPVVLDFLGRLKRNKGKDA
ncbi:MAG: ATP-dependent DNA helicase [Succinivibrionaceae bacterium]|nr:ATP-dependent DNA helicase [Succinivibrionaceae bacterium]